MSTPALPQRLAAPPPGWQARADVVVVGSGIAGLTAALRLRASGASVLLVTKTHLDAGSTRWAQGGIAAALAPDDTPEEHLADTLVAGVGLCEEDAVRVLVTEGPQRVRELVELGTRLDRTASGELALTREGGHHRDRIAHAGGDATGLEIERALIAAVRRDGGIEVVEHALVLDLLTDAGGRACGVTLHVIGEGARDGVGAVLGRAVVLATGGLGQVYASTTNPSVSTGDGVALALRAGADVADLEFVQFHPTVLWLGERSGGQQPLVSEAVRGEGAVLLDAAGERLMRGVHPMEDLAPRDIVAKAILRSMRASGSPHVWLDGRRFGEETWRRRFPTILASCLEHGVDPVTQLIPVVPACHYASGGVLTDLAGRTSVPGLYACGETACTGVHGANRLASNSLLEGLVFAARIADAIAAEGLPDQREPANDERPVGLLDRSVRPLLQRAMSGGAGVLRSAASLDATLATLGELAATPAGERGIEAWEATNLVTVSSALAGAARLREETRGSHWREDFPERDDDGWRTHLVTTLSGGTLQVRRVPLRPQPRPQETPA
ncbi:L-aspartate oxidase [Motilibacter rhizosphaerae]|uniref:L-aspartate oxidase n=1 Tax=Motilibacter rhizosphaerae TaxID=598652 RepID=A0A4Q7NAD5_9ACTN|nr:L-aspartate oxidase [Motilibacter rhizosphaerae]RZS79453.1 L-aspartate oxidase [Motilibacter rhizosphaerae]